MGATSTYIRAVTSTDPYDSDVSTADTVARMSNIVRNQVYSSVVVNAVSDAIKDVPPNGAPTDKARAIFYWIKTHIKFRNDLENTVNYLPDVDNPADKELLISPDLLLQLGYGDCDDFSMLAATMLFIVGIPARFITIAADARCPQHFTHIYVQAFVGKWIGFDVSHGSMLGWEYKRYSRIQVWNV